MKFLKYPFEAEPISGLRAGDHLTVSGRVFTGRDRLHKYLAEGGSLPCDLTGGALFHCGPVVVREKQQWNVLAAGPTTSIREEPYMPRIIAGHKIRLIIGKGGMGEATAAACREHGCVYLHLVGGAAALTAKCVRSVENVYFIKEFGMAEAMWILDMEGLEGIITMDTQGANLQQEIQEASSRALEGGVK